MRAHVADNDRLAQAVGWWWKFPLFAGLLVRLASHGYGLLRPHLIGLWLWCPRAVRKRHSSVRFQQHHSIEQCSTRMDPYSIVHLQSHAWSHRG